MTNLGQLGQLGRYIHILLYVSQFYRRTWNKGPNGPYCPRTPTERRCPCVDQMQEKAWLATRPEVPTPRCGDVGSVNTKHRRGKKHG